MNRKLRAAIATLIAALSVAVMVDAEPAKAASAAAASLPQVQILMPDLRITQVDKHAAVIRNAGSVSTGTEPVGIDSQGRYMYGFGVWFCYRLPLGGNHIVTAWVPPLAPGQSVRVDVSSVLADDKPEPLTGVTVDPHNFVRELFESNNHWGAGCPN